MEDWKSNRFVRVTYDVGNVLCKHMIVLTDIAFWAQNIDQLKEWCAEYNCENVGMTVEIEDDHTYTLFCLRWS